MTIWEIMGIALMIPTSMWLIKCTIEWWVLGSTMCLVSNPESHRQRMADWQQRIDDAQATLDYYLTTPNWFDLEWPTCNSLDVSSDGEYCRNCFRQVWEHAQGEGGHYV